MRFPAWYLGRHPDKQMISVSAEAGLAGDFGRQVRNLIASREYRAVFNTQLAEDSRPAANGTRGMEASTTRSALAARCSAAAATSS